MFSYINFAVFLVLIYEGQSKNKLHLALDFSQVNIFRRLFKQLSHNIGDKVDLS